MNIEIRELTPDLMDDYLHFFDNVAQEDCYCACYCSDDQTGIDFHKQEVRRKYAATYINDGKIKGYLAYCDGKPVGWCNANSKTDCLMCAGWKMMLSDLSATESADEKIKSIFCFTIAPGMRRSGIAAQLLERVCADAAKDGFSFVEAYPNKKFVDTYSDHMGPVDLYKKYGFVLRQEIGQKVVMRKSLNSDCRREL